MKEIDKLPFFYLNDLIKKLKLEDDLIDNIQLESDFSEMERTFMISLIEHYRVQNNMQRKI